MTSICNDENRYEKYINEHCTNCKNKTTNLCDIRIIQDKDIIITKCCFYEKVEVDVK